MNCPNDNSCLHPVSVRSHYGRPIVLEQCGQCGGIWFDESELFRAKQGEAEKIEALDAETLRAPTHVSQIVLKCPRDAAELYRFQDRYFPLGIILERCPACNGIWLNRGHFTRFQQARREIESSGRQKPPDEKLQQDIERILALHREGDNTGALTRLAAFLSTPMDRSTLRPLNKEYEPQEDSKVSGAIDIIMTLLGALLLR
jgi:Zn-finger nucleic acid-binding protein